ncbi:DNA internalization-related competence protein ComEC/Rec2 [Vibrio mexicanus]|uniref:DNA internalization-related competence protein ComEC/Rec2 n=1 Tax=Vibrio mexicanus TaxID=1004326 RepID=UPI000A034A5E|nr:DNA internalization-related competence protein ComEC/Rec2 [Vibrio mexicanus]
MVLFLNYRLLTSFALVVASSPYWRAIPSLTVCIPLLVVVIGCIKYRRYHLFAGASLAITVVVLHGQSLMRQTTHLFQDGRDITITAEVNSFFQQNSRGYQGTILARSINGQTLPAFAQGYIRLNSPILLSIGDQITARVTLNPVRGRLNLTGFDQEKYFLGQGWVAKATVNTKHSWRVDSGSSFRQALYNRANEHLQQLNSFSLLMALGFGDRSHITHPQWEQLKSSGLSHLVAISGLHIGIAYLFGHAVGALIYRVDSRLMLAPFLTGVIVASIYAWLAGFSIPTQRALIMCCVSAALLWVNLHLAFWQRALIVLSVILLLDPFAVVSVSFWLSFLSVCIVFFVVTTQSRQSLFSRLLVAQIAITVMTLPLIAYFFNGVSLSAIVYNLVFVPWVSLIVPIVFVALIATALDASSSHYIWQLCDFLMLPMLRTIEYSTHSWWSLSLGETWVLIYCAIAVVLYRLLSRYGRILMCCFLMVLSLSRLTGKPEYEWKMDVFDVGHGLAVLIESNQKAVLYDTGNRWEQGSYVESVIAPSLNRNGIDELDGLIISHDDLDHAGGREDAYRLIPPRWEKSSQALEPDKGCLRGSKWQWQSLSFHVLWPPKQVARTYNPQSCVISIKDGEGHTVLLTGDIPSLVEWLLVQRSLEDLKADVLLVPHHGSDTSSNATFIESVSPTWAIASTEYGGRWRLPNPDVVQTYLEQGVSWLDTGQNGLISVKFSPSNIEFETARVESKELGIGRCYVRE